MMNKKEQTILIVDASHEDREVLRRHLLQDSECTYAILEEALGEVALELCKKRNPDCILLNYNLPDMNGLEFLAELTDDVGSVLFPVVVLTGVSHEAIAVKAMKSGAQDYLVKGNITTANLHRAIQNAIERVELLQTVETQRHDLEQKNQELQTFAYALAHDLRAPLRAISSFAEIVEQNYQPSLDENGRHYMDVIVQSCKQMDHLIDDLLSYTRIEHRVARYQPVALQPLVTQIVDSLAGRLATVGSTMSIPEDLPVVYGDSTLISQIFINLLSNALTYRRPEVPLKITITCTVEANSYVISIADNGIGIAAKNYDRIFTIFQRLHSDDEYAGTGIGLAIVKKSAELMGGLVWVESTEGEGSTFRVRLPL
jgi:light-regulated signal transduction histidine kinase (bacteriophytochrome)